MAGEEGGMVNDGAMLWVVDDLHWNELRAERKNIQVRFDRLILLQNLREREGGRRRTECLKSHSCVYVHLLVPSSLSSQRTLAKVCICPYIVYRSVSEA